MLTKVIHVGLPEDYLCPVMSWAQLKKTALMHVHKLGVNA